MTVKEKIENEIYNRLQKSPTNAKHEEILRSTLSEIALTTWGMEGGLKDFSIERNTNFEALGVVFWAVLTVKFNDNKKVVYKVQVKK